MFWGTTSTALQALSADSTRKGVERTEVFTHRRLLENMGNLMGPIVSILMFLTIGDHWTVWHCSIVILIGQPAFLPAISL